MSLNRKQYGICFLLCVIIFALGLLLAASITLPDFLFSPVQGQSIDSSIIDRVRSVAMFKLILLNNSKVFLVFTLGILTCGIITLFQLFVIGATLGLGAQLGLTHGGSFSLILATLLPHGILEITAFMVVGALGFYFPFRIYRQIHGLAIDWTQEIKTYGLLCMSAYIVLFFAALIETFVTPVIVAKFLPSGHI